MRILRIAFDIGGVLSKHPAAFKAFLVALHQYHDLYVITDMHPKEKVVETLRRNGFLGMFKSDRILVSDYETHGDACKAVLLREHNIDVFFDDHPGYLVWPWAGPAPIRLRIEPDPYLPYWADEWCCDGGDFGRRRYLGWEGSP